MAKPSIWPTIHAGRKALAAERGASPTDTLARFTAEIASTKSPPGPTDTWLGEAIVHGEDIRCARPTPAGPTAQGPRWQGPSCRS